MQDGMKWEARRAVIRGETGAGCRGMGHMEKSDVRNIEDAGVRNMEDAGVRSIEDAGVSNMGTMR